MKVNIPISVGELLDKISILQIKSKYTNSTYVTKELDSLIQIAKENEVYHQNFLNQLLEVNQKLWKIEDQLREFEKNHTFDDDFVQLARSVYIMNDKRARIKRDINEYTNSELVEIKLYK